MEGSSPSFSSSFFVVFSRRKGNEIAVEAMDRNHIEANREAFTFTVCPDGPNGRVIVLAVGGFCGVINLEFGTALFVVISHKITPWLLGCESVIASLIETSTKRVR